MDKDQEYMTMEAFREEQSHSQEIRVLANSDEDTVLFSYSMNGDHICIRMITNKFKEYEADAGFIDAQAWGVPIDGLRQLMKIIDSMDKNEQINF